MNGRTMRDTLGMERDGRTDGRDNRRDGEPCSARNGRSGADGPGPRSPDSIIKAAGTRPESDCIIWRVAKGDQLLPVRCTFDLSAARRFGRRRSPVRQKFQSTTVDRTDLETALELSSGPVALSRRAARLERAPRSIHRRDKIARRSLDSLHAFAMGNRWELRMIIVFRIVMVC